MHRTFPLGFLLFLLASAAPNAHTATLKCPGPDCPARGGYSSEDKSAPAKKANSKQDHYSGDKQKTTDQGKGKPGDRKNTEQP